MSPVAPHGQNFVNASSALTPVTQACPKIAGKSAIVKVYRAVFSSWEDYGPFDGVSK